MIVNEQGLPTVIIGGGPAGLTAAYELIRREQPAIVLEKGDCVGGLARTECYNGFHFDMGGHRFYTKSRVVQQMWEEVLGDDLLLRPRLSRIYYRRKFFNYPLKPLNALCQIGPLNGLLIVLSYLRWQLLPHRREESFEQWVTNRFGRRLFQTFFQSYTEKVWGIPCSELKAEWAAQRIKDLSLRTVLLNMLWKPHDTIKTLIQQFHYPRLGPGMMWRKLTERIQAGSGQVMLNSDVVAVHRSGNRVESVTIQSHDERETIAGDHFISSMPVTELIKKLDPPPPPEVLAAAGRLKYRDFLTVCLIVDSPDLFADNWIYVHDPDVQVGRIQNFKNWSPDMVSDASRTSLGLEYFCSAGDDLWNTPDGELIELGKRELEQIGLARSADITDGCVFRVPHSYPVYDVDYRDHLLTIREFVDGLENLQTVGRNGLHRYNNQDHAMLTGMYAVRNQLLGEEHDLWSIHADQQYLEEVHRGDPDDDRLLATDPLPADDSLLTTGSGRGT